MPPQTCAANCLSTKKYMRSDTGHWLTSKREASKKAGRDFSAAGVNNTASRVGGLLGEFLAIDVERGEFQVVDVERKVELAEAGVGIELRIDRVDRLEDGRLVIIDYKTGAEKKLLDSTGAPREVQLVAYACAIEEPVAALALANVDSRVVGFQGAGEGFRALDDWDGQLAAWKDLVREACHRIAAGDVRISKRQSIEEARSLNLLTRFTELRNEW